MTITEYPRLPRAIPKWHEEAWCRFFPELADQWHDAKANSVEEFAVRTVCAACPVRFQCAKSALERGEAFGIWGGLDRRDRTRLAAEYGYPKPAVLPEHGTNSRRVKHGCTCVECREAHARYEFERRQRVLARGNTWRKRKPTPAAPPVPEPPTMSKHRYARAVRAHARLRRRRAHS